MTLHFHLSLYWLLLPLAVVLFVWATYIREEERYYRFIPPIAPLLRLAAAALIFLVVLCALLASHLWLK